ncbi:MAG: sialidase family protein, partial [Steroidobacteraceae bacterium]
PPTDPNRLYLAVGEYASPATHTWDGNGAILVSDDQGRTFTAVPLGFQNGSNDNGRNAGERFAVDPNSTNIVYFGSRVAGLQLSTDHGASWAQITGLPVTTTANGSGVISVLPIASSGSTGSATPVVYAAVAGTGVTAGGVTDPMGLYVTTSGGSTSSAWTAVSGQPSFSSGTELAPVHAVLGPDGSLYVLYTDQPGPAGISTSQLWKFKPTVGTWASGIWTQIALPPNPAGNSAQSGYGGIAVDPESAGVLLVATIDQYYPGDTVYRSTNDGATWTDISRTGGTHSTSGAPWIGDFPGGVSSGNWAGSVAIDPFNSAHALYGTGAMLWSTTNLTSADSGGTVAWNVAAQGIEETAVGFAIAPPSGATLLLSAMGDIYGFAHQTLTQSPPQGMYQNPEATPSAMDFEQNTPTTVVRVSSVTPYGVISIDGGLTWTAFGSMPSGTSEGAGSIAIAPDGSSIVWATADTGSVWYSTDGGASWSAASGLPPQARVVSDRVTAGVYYGYSGDALYVGTDGGASWALQQSGLPSSGQLVILPDARGDLWLAGGSAGLWHNTGSAAAPTLSTLSSVTAAYQLGFGAPASGTQQLTLYIAGIVGATRGLFRSIDGGSTWLQINSASQQFGGSVQGVTGDMRTFGTVYVGTNGRGIFWGGSSN